jgi:hypothetical protein
MQRAGAAKAEIDRYERGIFALFSVRRDIIKE